MKNIDWSDLNYFLATVREGSLAAAAKSLSVNHTTVSRRIIALEQQLNAPLFERSPSGLKITPLGEALIPYAENMQHSVNAVGRLVTADRQEMKGNIKVTAMELFARQILSPNLRTFSDAFPHIELELILGDDTLNLSAREADIAFRATDSPSPDVVGKRIGQYAVTMYCTAEVYQSYQQDPSSVSAIEWRNNLSDQQPDWFEQHLPGLKVRHSASTLMGLHELVKSGCGIAKLPCALGDANPGLIRVPDAPMFQGPALWVLTHIDLRTSVRIRTFRDFMVDALEKKLDLIEGNAPEFWKYNPGAVQP